MQLAALSTADAWWHRDARAEVLDMDLATELCEISTWVVGRYPGPGEFPYTAMLIVGARHGIGSATLTRLSKTVVEGSLALRAGLRAQVEAHEEAKWRAREVPPESASLG